VPCHSQLLTHFFNVTINKYEKNGRDCQRGDDLVVFAIEGGPEKIYKGQKIFIFYFFWAGFIDPVLEKKKWEFEVFELC
jgi:hypothetical protein